MSPAQRDRHARATERKAKASYLGDPAKGGGGLVETCFLSLGRMVAFPGKRPWLGVVFRA